jgi:ppGpp synthetase/RelA/SpoT-type nucleotidyltranferase
MMEVTLREGLLSDYDREKGVYADLASTVAILMQGMLGGAAVQLHSVTQRCKDRDSLSGKLSKSDKNYKQLSDITDIAAVRITTYFAEDVDRVAQIVEREFIIDWENSVDKGALLDPDRFGYQSLHYVALLSEDRTKLIEYSRLAERKIEIQIRSILQHAWAEIEHDLGYKSAAGIPRDIRRRFSRVAGLLELADDEFSIIRKELDVYAGTVSDNIQSSPEEVGIDKISLVAVVSSSDSSVYRVSEAVANIAEAELEPPNEKYVEDYVNDLRLMNVTTIAELERVAAAKIELVKKFAGLWFGTTYPSLDASIGLLYLIYVMVGETKDRKLVSEFVGNHPFGEPDALIDRILDTYNKAIAS